jgi:hypothetical protein
MHSYPSIVHRALVTYVNPSTGEIRVKIPAVTGNNTEISISRIGRQPVNGVWSMPPVGEQIVVSADDANMTNVFWLQTDGVSLETTQAIRYFNARDLVPTSSDVGKLIIMDSSSWVQTVQIDSDLGLTPGQRIDFVRIGTNVGGTVTFFGVDVFLNGTPGLKLRARYSAATIVCLFTNQYLLIGDLDA